MAPTPMGRRINEEFDDLRRALGRMHPDKAEQARKEILAVMVLIRMEVLKYVGVRRQRLPVMPEGVVFEALGMTDERYAALLEHLGRASVDLDIKDLLT
jgi:hypothetical protein